VVRRYWQSTQENQTETYEQYNAKAVLQPWFHGYLMR
jgi:hypothetical protein